MRRTPMIALLLVLAYGAFTMASAQPRVTALAPLDTMVPSSYDFGLPSWAPIPLEPAGNPTTPAKVELGRYLFYDKRLSRDRSMSCASCHEQERAFTDGRATSAGVSGQQTARNAMALANVAYLPVLTWANPLLRSLERQALVPLLGQEPEELGLAGLDQEAAARISELPMYRTLFARAFPEVSGDVSLATITRALAAFQRTMISLNSPYDRYRFAGDVTAVPEAAIRGEALFFSERLECHHCHTGLHLSDTIIHARNRVGEIAYHNTGLYNVGGSGRYPGNNRGIADVTGRDEDDGRFRAPSLRNVAVSAPYMHDGSIATLNEVIDHYAAGGRSITAGPYAGNGHDNPLKSSFVTGFDLSPEERADLLAFLQSLTDEQFLHDQRFSDPWTKEQQP